MRLQLRGVMPLLFNKMDLDAFEDSGPGKKRKPRARSDYEDMVWRDADGNLAIPTRNIVGSIVAAGKYFASPIASNGGATVTLREALVPATELSSFGVKEWDCIDRQLARNGDVSARRRWHTVHGWSRVARRGVDHRSRSRASRAVAAA